MNLCDILSDVRLYGDARALGHTHGAEVHLKRVTRALYALQDRLNVAEEAARRGGRTHEDVDDGG
jgi:hypothetical protein